MRITPVSNNIINFNKKNKIPAFQGYTLTSVPQRQSMYIPVMAVYIPERSVLLHYPKPPHDREINTYIASPFEIISEEIINSHDYLQRNDLYLGQIKKDYRNGYFDFASNADEEIKFLTTLKENHLSVIDKNQKTIDKFKTRSEENEDESLIKKYDEKIKDIQNSNNNENKSVKALNSQIQKANKRLELLAELDKLGAEKNDMMQTEKKKISFKDYKLRNLTRNHTDNIEKIIKEFKDAKSGLESKIDFLNSRTAVQNETEEETELQKNIRIKNEQKIKKLKAEFNEKKKVLKQQLEAEKSAIKEIQIKKELTQKELDSLIQQFAVIDTKLDAAYAKVEKFYIENYPDWL